MTIWMEFQSFQHFNRNSSLMVNNQLSVTFVLYFTALALSAFINTTLPITNGN